MFERLATLLVSALGCAALYFLYRNQKRSARDVARDLCEQSSDSRPRHLEDSFAQQNRPVSKRVKVEGLRIDSSQQALQQTLMHKFIPFAFAFVGLLISCVFSAEIKPTTLVVPAVFGLALGFIAQRVLLSFRDKQQQRELEFYLPVVMERVVMAVQAGLDIVAALKRVVELEKNGAELLGHGDAVKLDPVTKLLDLTCKLCESGLGFEESLRYIASNTQAVALKHAFIHLAVAYKEGGELIMPLTELSDSTQLYYQESIEEEIARMPVKATMPLVLTFAGLIVCFITAPLMQVLNILTKAMPG